MATHNQPDDELNTPTDPAQLGADQAPVSQPEDDPRDMSTVRASASDFRDGVGLRSPRQDANSGGSDMGQGSDFDRQRRQGAAGTGDNSGAVGRGEGMGRAGFNNDEDRGYDQSGQRGGVGSSGGREDLSDRNPDTQQNPFTGEFELHNRPDDALTQRIGMNNPNPAKPDQNSDEAEQAGNSTAP
ncbi:hypothetical protein [Hymenobacter jejuensis]|uniref:Uncharacterized protein n=1 Tax=Hymenobacter jejuensis TaxID=2502781 RepID=A0A5B8A5J1_9BACT|nr:hypothetical protein [Hymenobacter jejuensis]QDA61472.1 hypothetical protein FHG12_15800 [Hymenobacter jejuensis]